MTPASIEGLKDIRMAKESSPEMYKVVGIFYTLQGEGPNAGEAAVFVRFSHCNLSCSWCDTSYDKGEWKSRDELMEDIRLSWLPFQPGKLPSIVMTGGEPSLQVDLPLLDALHRNGYEKLTIETNGLKWNSCLPAFHTVVCSPKTKEGWWNEKINRPWLSLKVVYDRNNPDMGTILSRALASGAASRFISPLEDQTTKTTNHAECVEYVKRNPAWRLSLQTHKYLQIE